MPKLSSTQELEELAERVSGGPKPLPASPGVAPPTAPPNSPTSSTGQPTASPASPPSAPKGPKVTAELSLAARTLRRFATAWDMYQVLFDDLPESYQWQFEELTRLSGFADPYQEVCDETTRLNPTKERPMLYTLQAANGSGKDQMVLALWALWFICYYPQSHFIATSSSYTQLDEQTWRHIKARAERINSKLGCEVLDIAKHKVRFRELGSEITLYRTDESGKTEGWHPFVDGGKMAIVLNEGKSLKNELVMSFRKCHGYTHWVTVSSPGEANGYFYDRCHDTAQVRYPAPLELGRYYHRKITWEDCPHLKAEYERDAAEFGANSPYVRSSYGAEFTAEGVLVLIDPYAMTYQYPAPMSMLPRRAGIDFALGGDACVMSIWEDNYFVREIEWYTRHEPTLTPLIADAIDVNRIPLSNIYGDAGNFGTVIMQRLGEMGYPINGVHNQAAAARKKVFLNRGTELAWNFRRIIVDKRLNLSKISSKLRRQCSERLYFLKDGNKLQLEAKPDFRKRRGYSPDHLDAAILAHAGVQAAMFAPTVAPAEPEPVTVTDTILRNWEKIYGKFKRPGNGAIYRTSGCQPGKKVQTLDQRFRGH